MKQNLEFLCARVNFDRIELSHNRDQRELVNFQELQDFVRVKHVICTSQGIVYDTMLN